MTINTQTIDELRAAVDQAQQWLHQADQSVILQLEDEAFSDGATNPEAHETQRNAELHLLECERQLTAALEAAI